MSDWRCEAQASQQEVAVAAWVVSDAHSRSFEG
jgi:hypothetical protein